MEKGNLKTFIEMAAGFLTALMIVLKLIGVELPWLLVLSPLWSVMIPRVAASFGIMLWLFVTLAWVGTKTVVHWLRK